MKKYLLGLMLMAGCLGAQAQNTNGYYIGLIGGTFDIDASDRVSGLPVNIDDDESTFGVQVGFNLTRNWTVEVEYMTAEADAEVTIVQGFAVLGGPVSFTNQIVEVEVDVDAFSLFLAYRSSGDFYVFGKAGATRVDFEFDESTGLGAGLGVGFRFGDFYAIEAGYTFLDSDLSFAGITTRVVF